MSRKYLKNTDAPEKDDTPKKLGKKQKKLLIVASVLVVLIVSCVIFARANGIKTFSDIPKKIIMIYARMTTKAEDATIPGSLSDAVINGGQADTFESAAGDAVTWPEVVPTQNVTTIMLVGQDYRKGEEHYLSDTMIMCTINRDTNTLTMTSIMRDLYVPLPDYANHGPGRNRINVCYNLGTVWTGSVKGGMEMLSMCVEQNFGIHVDHTVEVNFVAFEKIIDRMGGVEITLTQAEADYLNNEETHREWSYYPDHVFSAGTQTLNGKDALAYSRIRKIDSDFQRTQRQRNVMNSLIKKCKKMGIWDLHKMATEILPLITTDMTDEEMANYIWELIPMLVDLNVVSQRIPLEKDQLNGEWGYTGKEVEGIGYVIEPNLIAHKKYLQEILGYADVEE